MFGAFVSRIKRKCLIIFLFHTWYCFRIHFYVTICMKLDPGMHIGLHLVSFGKSGVTLPLLFSKKKIMSILIYEHQGKVNPPSIAFIQKKSITTLECQQFYTILNFVMVTQMNGSCVPMHHEFSHAKKTCLDFHTDILLYSPFRIRVIRSILMIIIVSCIPILTERSVSTLECQQNTNLQITTANMCN
jgi:hypothetical protein